MGPGFESLEVHHNNKIRTFPEMEWFGFFVFIDAVTGATVTSNAIKSAVNAAIEEAGASPASLPEAYATAGDPAAMP